MSMDNVHTINLGKVLLSQRQHRAVRAINMIKEYTRRHKGDVDVKIDTALSEAIWSRGVRRPPRKVTVEMVVDDDGSIIVMEYDGGVLSSSVEVSEPDVTEPEKAESDVPRVGSSVSVDGQPAEPDTTVTPEPDTTVTPEPEPDTTVTPEPEPDTTVTPEPEPDTTVTPEPEPDTTVTPEPEPEPDTTVTPEPEPDTTVTVTPEPEPDTEIDAKSETINEPDDESSNKQDAPVDVPAEEAATQTEQSADDTSPAESDKK